MPSLPSARCPLLKKMPASKTNAKSASKLNAAPSASKRDSKSSNSKADEPAAKKKVVQRKGTKTANANAPANAGRANANAPAANAPAANAGRGRPRMTNSQIENDPVIQCKRAVRREIGAKCMQDKEMCPIIQECGKFGVGSEDWPLDVDRLPEEKFRLFFEETLADGSVVKNKAGMERWREGRRCIRNVMRANDQFNKMFDDCNLRAPNVRASKQASKTNSRKNVGI